ncbi:MAG: hypothetical protein JO132_18085 [Streptosporangiaceae bacterium]|nr:hypothetical protein [Streptosporangiaceae bacterium]
MNDDNLITRVREPFTAVHMDTPIEQIIRRGRAVRARRRIPGVAGAAAAVAGAALAGAALLPVGHPPNAQLAAYTVNKQANGTIEVTINELRDPSGLQATLRADGVPASVTYVGQPNPSCRNYFAGKPPSYVAGLLIWKVIRPNRHSAFWQASIQPSALPRDAGVDLGFKAIGTSGNPNAALIETGLVYASPKCTGLSGPLALPRRSGRYGRYPHRRASDTLWVWTVRRRCRTW